MKPILFQIGSFVFPAYHLLIMIGVLVGLWFGLKLCKRYNFPAVYVFDLAIIGILAGFIGARLAHVFIEAPHYYWESPVRVFYIWQGGFVSFGAHIAIAFAFVAYLKFRQQPVLAWLDGIALCFPLTILFGRIGCLLQGCCFGKPTDFFLHLTFHNPASTAFYFHPNTPLHATQIYLILKVALIQLILLWIYKTRHRFQGQLFAWSIGLYAIGRFLIEFLRGDIDRGLYFNESISSAQIVMIGYALTALIMYRIFKRKNIETLPYEKTAS